MAVLELVQYPAVESIPGKVSGAWVFKGTWPQSSRTSRTVSEFAPITTASLSRGKGWNAVDVGVHTDPAAVCKYVPGRVLKPATLTS